MINSKHIKNQLRAKHKDIRNNLPLEYRKSASLIIAKSAIFLIDSFKPTIILAYSSFSSEVSTDLIIKHALARKIQVALPACEDDTHNNMSFFYINDINQTKTGLYNIKEPAKSHAVNSRDINNRAICFIPGVAFDKRGARLGFGKGYYDKFLSDFPGIKIGLAFDENIETQIISESHDICVDKIITQTEIYEINNSKEVK